MTTSGFDFSFCWCGSVVVASLAPGCLDTLVRACACAGAGACAYGCVCVCASGCVVLRVGCCVCKFARLDERTPRCAKAQIPPLTVYSTRLSGEAVLPTLSFQLWNPCRSKSSRFEERTQLRAAKQHHARAALALEVVAAAPVRAL